MGASGTYGLLFYATKWSGAFLADMPAELRVLASRLGGFTRLYSV